MDLLLYNFLVRQSTMRHLSGFLIFVGSLILNSYIKNYGRTGVPTQRIIRNAKNDSLSHIECENGVQKKDWKDKRKKRRNENNVRIW